MQPTDFNEQHIPGSVGSETPLSPGAFMDLCSPAWARVYIETSFGRKPEDERLPWFSGITRSMFVSLTGFDPARVQFSSFNAQHAALNSCRELDVALYQADEIEELDGKDALEFANGWMTCRTWLSGADRSALPDEQAAEEAALRAAQAAGVSPNHFVPGFVKRAAMGHEFVG